MKICFSLNFSEEFLLFSVCKFVYSSFKKKKKKELGMKRLIDITFLFHENKYVLGPMDKL